MNPSLFYDSFSFNEFRFKKYKFTDNMHGIKTHYIGFMRSGHAKIVSEEGVTEIKEGELFYLPLGCRYRSYWYGDPDIRFDSYAFTHYPQKEHRAFCHATVPMTEKAKRYLEALSADKEVSCASVSKLYALFSQMLPLLPYAEQSPKKALFEKAKKYIEHNLHFSAKDLAKACGISESGLYALFKEQSGQTPISFKNRILTEKAAFLLETTDMSSEEIGHSLGFNSAAYFRKLFFSFYGVMPREYRRQNKNKV